MAAAGSPPPRCRGARRNVRVLAPLLSVLALGVFSKASRAASDWRLETFSLSAARRAQKDVPACAWTDDDGCPVFRAGEHAVGRLSSDDCPSGTVVVEEDSACQGMANRFGFPYEAESSTPGAECHVCIGCVPVSVQLRAGHRDHHLFKLVCARDAQTSWDEILSEEEELPGGGVVLLAFVSLLYMFVCLGMVVDEFYVPANERIAEKLELSDDVAGATLMSAGGCAPYLFTTLSGTLRGDADIGVGTVVGSFAASSLLCIGICAAVSPSPVYLNWFPMLRDSCFFLVGLVMLACVFADAYVQVFEAVLLFILYFGYVLFMKFSGRVYERLVGTAVMPAGDIVGAPEIKPPTQMIEPETWVRPVADDIDLAPKPIGAEDSEAKAGPDADGEDGWDDEHFDVWPPWGARPQEWAYYVLTLPVALALFLTIPVTWPVTSSLISLVWIGLFTYLLVWFATIVSAALGVSTYVMGLVVIASGLSVPDFVSCVVVAMQGYADYAVSSSLGANVFDLGVSLPIPWLIYHAVEGGAAVALAHEGSWACAKLGALVLLVLILIRCFGWTISRVLGYLVIAMYAAFISSECISAHLSR